jgi:hypothetical protein
MPEHDLADGLSARFQGSPMPVGRRDFVSHGLPGALLAASSGAGVAQAAEAEKAAVLAQIRPMHAENVKRLQDWIALPSIAAENRNYPQGPELMADLARRAGFSGVTLVPTASTRGTRTACAAASASRPAASASRRGRFSASVSFTKSGPAALTKR